MAHDGLKIVAEAHLEECVGLVQNEGTAGGHSLSDHTDVVEQIEDTSRGSNDNVWP